MWSAKMFMINISLPNWAPAFWPITFSNSVNDVFIPISHTRKKTNWNDVGKNDRRYIKTEHVKTQNWAHGVNSYLQY